MCFGRITESAKARRGRAVPRGPGPGPRTPQGTRPVMKKRTKKILLTVVVVVVAVLACVGGWCGVQILGQGTSSKEQSDGTVVCSASHVGSPSVITQAWLKYTVYDVDKQESIAQDLESQHAGQTIDDPLVVYNPFGTSSQSLYVYFETEEAASVSYTVSVSDEEVATIADESLTSTSIDDFTREVDDGEAATEHEFTLGGLIPGVENGVSITATYEDGSSDTYEFTCDMCDVLGAEELQLVVEEGESTAELEDGLYAILGNEHSDAMNFVYFYDNDGILRGELPLAETRSQRLIFEDDLMYFSYTNTELCAMNELGQVVKDYPLNDDGTRRFRMHHDYVSNGDYLIILGTDNYDDTIEDLVYFLNKETGVIDYTLDMGDLMGSYKESALEYHYANTEDEGANYDGEEGVDWIHINGVQWMGNDSILLSCREISSIIKVSDVFGEPAIDYILSSEEYWEDTEYADLVYAQDGEFTVQGGQHSIEYIEDDSLEDGQYYIVMFNNNLGLSAQTTSDFDYASVGLTISERWSDDESYNSYYYKYLVDENAGTFALVRSIAVPYSGLISSAQDLETNVVVDSGLKGIFGEYDENDELIRQFTLVSDTDENSIYRVYKYDL